MIGRIFDFHFQCRYNPVCPSTCLCREAIQSQCLPPTLYVNLIATHISGVRIIRAYNIDDLYHTGRNDLSGMVKIVYIVCTSKLNNNNIIIANNVVLQSKNATRWVICDIFFCLVSWSLEKKTKKKTVRYTCIYNKANDYSLMLQKFNCVHSLLRIFLYMLTYKW